MAQDIMDFDRQWNYANPAATAARFYSLLAHAQSQPPSYRLQLLTQIARTHSLRNEFAQAHSLLDDVRDVMTAYPLAQVRYWLERGRTYNGEGEAEKAIAAFEHAYQIATRIGEDYYAVDAAHMLAIASKDPHVQIDWNLRALDLAAATSETRAQNWFGALYNNLGWAYHEMGDYVQALAIFQKALDWREKQGNVRAIRTARWTIGYTLRTMGRLVEALAVQRALLAEYDADGARDGFVYEEIGEILFAMGRQDEARPYFAWAYDDLSKKAWLMLDQPERLEKLRDRAAGAI